MNAQTVDAIATARLGGLLEPQVARLQVRLMAEMVEQLGTLATNSAGGVVDVADAYTLSDADNGKVVFIGTDEESEAWVYLDESNPPATGFSCSIVAKTSNVKVGWNGSSSTLTGPGLTNNNWAINDATNNGVGMGATLVVTDSATLIAHIIGSVEATA